MKQKSSISELCGITHKDMAMLLGVGQTHYSMFESGKRDLPIHAMQTLTEVLTYMQTPQHASRSDLRMAADKDQRREQLDFLLKENSYQQLRIKKEMEVAERKFAREIRRSQVAGFLLESANNKSEALKLPYVVELGKTPKISSAKTIASFIANEIRLETLEFEKQLLESKLKSLQIRK